MASSRQRCRDPGRVAGVLAPFATVPDFILYEETLEAKMNKANILKNRDSIVFHFGSYRPGCL